MDVAIKISNLSKVFKNKKSKREIWALDNVSFKVNKGEIFGLLGPNGAGKTTTIRLIAGLLKPTTGEIFINGQNIKKESHKIRKFLGFLTENHGSYENLTVLDNLRFFGSFYDIDHLNLRIDEILREMGLFERKNMKVGKLSKGQKQRLAIARAILHDPKIIFFDEPTSNLDPSASVKVRNMIRNLKGKQRTLFINSHNLEEVQKLCDRVAILDLGKIKRIGTPSELSKELWDSQEMVCTLKNPVNLQIKRKLKDMNFIKQFRIEKNKIYIYSDDANKTTPIIVKELVNLGAEILEINRTIHSLEDIYLKLIEKKT
ncbi:MAG: ABC transporter ATP-binding protein [Promethearchaeota archaeon]